MPLPPRLNRALSGWLESGGAMLRTDHVELRRWLVDAGLLARDGYGRVYIRNEEASARAQDLVGPGSPGDFEDAVATLRSLETGRRAAGREAFESRL